MKVEIAESTEGFSASDLADNFKRFRSTDSVSVLLTRFTSIDCCLVNVFSPIDHVFWSFRTWAPMQMEIGRESFRISQEFESSPRSFIRELRSMGCPPKSAQAGIVGGILLGSHPKLAPKSFFGYRYRRHESHAVSNTFADQLCEHYCRQAATFDDDSVIHLDERCVLSNLDSVKDCAAIADLNLFDCSQSPDPLRRKTEMEMALATWQRMQSSSVGSDDFLRSLHPATGALASCRFVPPARDRDMGVLEELSMRLAGYRAEFFKNLTLPNFFGAAKSGLDPKQMPVQIYSSVQTYLESCKSWHVIFETVSPLSMRDRRRMGEL